MATSIWNRKRDLVYLSYFLIHIPIMFAIDLTSLYPPEYTPRISSAIKSYHVTTFGDQFFVSPPPFFLFFMWMEVFFHIPICLWSIRALLQDNPQIPLVLLIYAMQTLVTTGTCMYEYFQWTTVSIDTKWTLTTVYGPYLALSLFMAVDAGMRISSALSTVAKTHSVKKHN